MIVLPPAIAPPAPFPLIAAQASEPEFVAPGIRRSDYRLRTNAGPIVVHVVAIDPREPTVRLRTVVAHDRMISSGETVSAMAGRTNAVAGVNADYFDIGNTNQPLNVVVEDGALVRTPSTRAALQIGTNGAVAMGDVTFAGSVTYGASRVPLTTVNEWPPHGGAALLTPAYGSLATAGDVVVATLEPVSAAAGLPGTYRVASLDPPPAGPVAGTLLGFGPAAQRAAAPPAVGDLVELAFDTNPAAGTLNAAVGGGPLLITGGLPFDDPNSPAPEERDRRFPVSGAALTANGTLLLIAVDGRRPATSIGVTRPEFGALMRGFGATSGMAFDSGGSATLVARALGDASASVMNEPSDGRERPVANGIFAYSTAPLGVHPHLIVRPQTFAALAGSRIDLTGAVVDDAGHRLRGAVVPPLSVDPAAGERVTTVRERGGTLTASVHYRSVDRIASLTIVPDRPNPAPAAHVPFAVRAFDRSGAPVLIGADAVRWQVRADGSSATAAAGPRFDYTAASDATVTARIGGATASTLVRVGAHAATVDAFTERTLAYDFTGAARAAYSNLALALPDEPKSIALDVFGDGTGVGVRAALLNRFGERVAVTVARRLDWQGWQRRTIAVPPELNPPLRLVSLYVVPSLGGPRVRAAGTVRFRNLAVTIPGLN